MTPETRWRGETYEVVSTTCNSDADCTGVEETCVKAKRCDPNVKRRAVADAEVAPKPATDPAASGPTPVAEEPGDDEIVQRPGCAVGGAAPAAWLLLLPAALIARRR